MIEHYSDHAANERTFLAWVRTAIAVMAFGFLIERFDIFLAVMASGARSRAVTLGEHKFANDAGLAFILIGVAMIIVAAIRFALRFCNGCAAGVARPLFVPVSGPGDPAAFLMRHKV
jgi:putative membrane protein